MQWIRRLLPLALLILTTCSSPGERRFTSLATQRGVSAATLVEPTNLRSELDGVLAARLGESPTLPAWSTQMPFRHLASAAYMAQRFEALGLHAVVERTTDDGIEALNVYADIRGTTRPDEFVLLTGHHDSWFTGADDNASALAVLLEAARILRTMPGDRTVRFIAFDREEEGLMGSARYVRDHAAEHIVGFVNLDCVAFASSQPGSQMSPPGLAVRDVGNFAAVIASGPAELALARAMALAPALPRPVDALGLMAPEDGHYPATTDFLRSDHAPFWRSGIPGLFITDTASFRNPHYHTATDTAETLDYEFFRRTAAYIIAVVAAMSVSE